MALPKSTVGVLETPQDVYQYSMNKQLAEKQASKKEALSAAFPLASSSLGPSYNQGGGLLGFFKNVLIVGGVAAGSIFAIKKFKLSKAASGVVSTVGELKSHLTEVVTTAKSQVLKPFNVKKTTIRVTDEAADVIKEALDTTRKLASEAKNIEGKSPKIVVRLKENSGEAVKTIKEALAKNDINSLSDDALKNIEYINLDYVSSDKNSSKILIDIIKGEISGSNNSSASGGWDKAAKFFKEFLGD